MRNSFRQLSNQASGRAIRDFVFFILFYLYLWLEVDLRLIHHGAGIVTDFPVFYRGWSFFADFLVYPGGLVEYLAAFLAQFLYYSWAGAIVVTAVAWLICVCTSFFFRAVNAPTLRWARFVPPILLLILYTQYTFHFVTTVALLAALGFVCLYLKVIPKAKSGAFVVFLVLSVVLYYLAGGVYLFFAVLCALYELFFARRWQLGLTYLLSALVIPYVGGVLIFDVSIIDAFGKLLPCSWETATYEDRRRMSAMVYILYLVLPLAALGLGLWRTLMKAKVKKAHSKVMGPPAKILLWYAGSPQRRWITDSMILFAIAAIAVLVFHNNKLKSLFAVDYYTCRQMWPQVLATARRHPDGYFSAHPVNQALYHIGRLGYDMFCYSQQPQSPPPGLEHIFPHWQRAGTLIELGLMSMVEHDLTESLEIFGERPLILKRLALVNLVKGDIGAARIYLGALSKTLFHTDWANNCLEKLEADPNLSTDNQVLRLRSLTAVKDYGALFFESEDILSRLLEKNSQNRMAFEYLMALYLLTRQLDKFVQNLGRLSDFDYSQIPRHYEEAILIYEGLTGRKVDFKGRRLDPKSLQRFKNFENLFNYYGRNESTAFDDLAKYYGDSYFFYYLYGRSGIKK